MIVCQEIPITNDKTDRDFKYHVKLEQPEVDEDKPKNFYITEGKLETIVENLASIKEFKVNRSSTKKVFINFAPMIC